YKPVLEITPVLLRMLVGSSGTAGGAGAGN
ncbi:uncharacterized protein METZ01_LOCUS209336, partial [marine metagenome]